jgi:Secretion system C-terminal sorting domain/Immunoglobulin domain
MRKIILTLLFACSISTISFAQKELWATGGSNVLLPAPDYNGTILKFDINGENEMIMHNFDYEHGITPRGKLFLASNGKLYGTTIGGGFTSTFLFEGAGVLYEYDLILNQYRVVHYFNETHDWKPQSSVIEPIPGVLYGTCSASVYSYDLNTETFTFLDGYTLTPINGELMKASDGYLYGTTKEMQPCLGTNAVLPNNGTIFKVNTASNTIQTVYMFNCDMADGIGPTGGLIEASPGKLYGTAFFGGLQVLPDFQYGKGVLFEYNINANVLTEKVNFDGDSLGMYPSPLANGNNGNLYGVCFEGGTTTDFFGNVFHTGTLFEYNPVSNEIEKLHNFGDVNNTGLYPSSIVKTTIGHFAGTKGGGFPFKFDPVDNSVTTTCSTCSTNEQPFVNPLNFTEICRKPFYHFFDVDTFNPCVNTPFTFDVQNTNATSYTWKKDGVIVPMQTTGILNIPNITAADSGNYTCEMVNECGTTVTMVLHITVGCLGIDEMAAFNKLISLYPNPAGEIVNIKLPENSNLRIEGCTISNMLGQVVFESNGDNSQITIANYATGLYSLILKTDKGNWFGKFVKE